MPAPRPVTKENMMARTKRVGACRIWTGNINKRTGYGNLWANGRTREAHVVSFELYHGPVPKGKGALHSCDVRSCIELDHLYAGTRKQNSMDMYSRGRNRNMKGIEHGMSKLTDAQIAEARRRYKPYDRQNSTCALAREFGVTQATMYSAVMRKTWAHVQKEHA